MTFSSNKLSDRKFFLVVTIKKKSHFFIFSVVLTHKGKLLKTTNSCYKSENNQDIHLKFTQNINTRYSAISTFKF